MELYKDELQPIEVRVEDLMSRMSIEEKVRQLGCTMALDARMDPKLLDLEAGIGGVAMTPTMMTAAEMAEYIHKIQTHVIENSTHGIPAIFSLEALGGPVMAQGQQFPISISLGASFEPELIRDMCQRSRRQLRAAGIGQVLSPVMDVARDLRWGRVAETYGGDPTLVSSMSCAFVEEIQKKENDISIQATAKHFLGYSSTEGGLNMARTYADKRELREVYAKPFEAAIRKGGLKSIMNSYSEIDSEPVCASKEILDTLLREELGFEGFVISDAMSIPRLVRVFKTATDITDAGKQCLAAGLDMELPNREGYGDDFIEAVKNKEVDEALIDRSVKRILTAKFEMGLFEHPYPDLEDLPAAFNNTDNDTAALHAARKTMTLTKNDGILPLRDKEQKIAVIGPHGEWLRMLYSGYSWVPHMEMMSTYQNAMAGMDATEGGTIESIAAEPVRNVDMTPFDGLIRQQHPNAKTIIEALRETFPDAVYERGCSYNDATDTDFEAAVKAAEEADVVVMTVGGKNGWGLFCTSGEGIDSSSLDLPGAQEELMRVVQEANPNIIVVHVDARPLVSEWVYDKARAVIEAWLPCHAGGTAIAETLTGKNNPGGRLPVDVPRSIGHTPVYHYQHNGTGIKSFAPGAVNPDGYIDSKASSLLPFGFGLSYTQFAYSEHVLEYLGDGKMTAEVSVRNIGSMDGDEVIQLYISDEVASIIRPEQELIGFKRVSIPAGKSIKVKFFFNLNQTAFQNKKGEWVVEAGDFHFFIGGNSADDAQKILFTLKETILCNHKNREFFARAEILL